MTGWPANNKPADFSDLCDQVVRAIRFAYLVRRKNEDKDIPISVIDAPETATTRCGSQMLTAESLRDSKEEQGRDALTEIVGFALRLGIEQGDGSPSMVTSSKC